MMLWKTFGFIFLVVLIFCVGMCDSDSSKSSSRKRKQPAVQVSEPVKDTLNAQQHRGIEALKSCQLALRVGGVMGLDGVKKNKKIFKDAFIELLCGDNAEQKICRQSDDLRMIWKTGGNNVCAIVPLNEDYSKSGEGFVFDGAGTLRIALEYADNVLNGDMVLYDKNQKMLAKVPYVNGKENGVAYAYYPSGKLMSKGEYKNGYQEGLEQGFFENGDLYSEANYKRGKIVGSKIRYWKKTGAILAIIPYKNGVENGIAQRFSKEGQAVEEIPYVGGKINGVYKTYCRMSGNRSQMTYKNGIPVSQKSCVNADGVVTKRGLESMNCCDEEKVLAELKDYIEENSSRTEAAVRSIKIPKTSRYKVHKAPLTDIVIPKYE